MQDLFAGTQSYLGPAQPPAAESARRSLQETVMQFFLDRVIPEVMPENSRAVL